MPRRGLKFAIGLIVVVGVLTYLVKEDIVMCLQNTVGIVFFCTGRRAGRRFIALRWLTWEEYDLLKNKFITEFKPNRYGDNPIEFLTWLYRREP